jgi:hypothetical protein
MTILGRLDRWKETGAITGLQHATLSAIVRKERFSVFVELNVLLYLGVLSFVAGIVWVTRIYFAELGDAAVLSGLTFLLGLSLYYCFSRAAPYSREQVEAPNLVFDYALYLACMLFASELAYIEVRFQILQDYWDYYFLASALLFFVLAYRFDNRLVLSLALSTLAGWFGLRISRIAFASGESLRPYALAYGVVVAGAGTLLYRRGIKKHFTETYFHVAANVLFIALLSGVVAGGRRSIYLAGLLGCGAVSIIEGARLRRFLFVVYGTVYSFEVLRDSRAPSAATLAYLVISASVVIAAIALLARKFGRDE